jgi:uncharacterized protein DUF3616
VIKRAALDWLRLFGGVAAVLCMAWMPGLAHAAGPWISEILFNPPGTVDAPNEYVEIRGTPNSIVPAGTYLISIEGNTNGNAGTIQNVFDLSGRAIGGNGFLVLLQNSNTFAPHMHASVVVNTNGPGWGHGSSSTVGHRGRTSTRTDIENPSITFLLIQSSLAPVNGDDIDEDNDGFPESPVFSTWNVLDGVGILDNTGLGDVAYGPINFRRNAASTVLPGSTVVPINFTADYVARSGNTTGWAAADWVVSEGLTGTPPTYTLGGTTVPSTFGGRMLNHLGAPNFDAPLIAGIVVTQTGNSTTVTEGSGTDSYTIALNSNPNGTVDLFVNASDGQVQISTDNGATYGASRTISLNSTVPRTILVRALDDNVIEMVGHTDRIVHSISSSTSAVYPPGTLAPAITVSLTDNEFVLLSELKVNPPGTDDAPYEFIELRGSPGAQLRNIYVVVIEGDAGADPGTARMVVDLNGVSLGANGFLVIAAPGHPYSVPTGSAILLDSQLNTVGGALGNGSISFFLLSSPASIPEGEDLDGGDNGILEELPEGAVLIDAVSWTDGDTDDVLYGGVVLQQAQGTPDAATRLSNNSTPLSAAAWFCGDLNGSNPASLAYDPPNVSTNFPAGTPLSPGGFNNTAPNVSAIAPICGVIGDPTNPRITFTFNDAESGTAGVTVSVTSSNQLVVPNANLVLTIGGAGLRTLTINPIGVGYSTIYIRVSDGVTTNVVEVPYAASEMGRPGGIFHIGAADASAAIPIDNNLMWVGDDENQIIRIYNRNASGLPIATFNMTPFLGLTDIEAGRPREVDIEGATRVGNRIFWIGAHSHANIAEGRTNRSRVFASDISGSGAASTLTYVGRYDFLKLDLVNWDISNGHGKGANYYGLDASTAEGVDPKTPMGFNIEGLCMAPGSSTVAYIALRAPIVPAATRTHALLVPVVNFTTVAIGTGPPGSAQFGAPIELDLFQRGFRSIEWNGFEYLIVAGTPYDNTGAYPRDFRLFTWSGNPADQPRQRGADLTDMNPEAIVELPNAPLQPTDQIQIISDNGRRLWYGDDIQAKFLPVLNFKKFRSDRVTLGPVVKSAPYIISNIVSQTGITITWRSRQGDAYRLRYKTSLTSPNWIDVSGDVTATGTMTTKFHALPPSFQRFYRVTVLP